MFNLIIEIPVRKFRMYIINFILIFVLNFYFYDCNVTVYNEYTADYHLRPPYGWMNDPNGFCVYNGEFHLFYQHNPYSSFEPGIAHWRQAKSTDLFNWEDCGIAMYPDEYYDKDGAFSGSTLVENNTMYIFYTGNINYPDGSRIQHQALTISTDGVNFKKYAENPIINGSSELQNIRDPKVWKKDDTYYMVLGVSYSNNTRGAVVLYSSNDKISWQEVTTLAESDGSLGFMWECPDFFELNGYYVLMISPEINYQQGNETKVLQITGYFIGTFDYTSYIFTNVTDFIVLDEGHDFYASQTTQDCDGRRIMVAWLDMWKRNYTERYFNVTGQMTIPRTLTISESKTLLQQPVKEVENVRGDEIYNGKCQGGDVVTLNSNAAVIYIKASKVMDFDLILESQNSSTNVFISYNARTRYLTLNRGGTDGVRRTTWNPTGMLRWTVFIDSSSIELFAGEGELTMSSRTFPTGSVKVRLGDNSVAEEMQVFDMKRTVYFNDSNK